MRNKAQQIRQKMIDNRPEGEVLKPDEFIIIIENILDHADKHLDNSIEIFFLKLTESFTNQEGLNWDTVLGKLNLLTGQGLGGTLKQKIKDFEILIKAAASPLPAASNKTDSQVTADFKRDDRDF